MTLYTIEGNHHLNRQHRHPSGPSIRLLTPRLRRDHLGSKEGRMIDPDTLTRARDRAEAAAKAATEGLV